MSEQTSLAGLQERSLAFQSIGYKSEIPHACPSFQVEKDNGVNRWRVNADRRADRGRTRGLSILSSHRPEVLYALLEYGAIDLKADGLENGQNKKQLI